MFSLFFASPLLSSLSHLFFEFALCRELTISWYPSEPDAQLWAYERLARRIAIEGGMKGVIPVVGDVDSDAKGAGDGDKEMGEDGEIPDGVWAERDGDDSGSGEEWDPKDWGR
jgi:hypothetical protein